MRRVLLVVFVSVLATVMIGSAAMADRGLVPGTNQAWAVGVSTNTFEA